MEGGAELVTLADAVLGGKEAGEALASAAANLRRELEGIAGVSEGGEGFREWVEEALRTLGSVDAGIAALRENRCVTWEASERTVAATVARIQHIQHMLS